jgi:hypothetical protein
MGNIHLRQKKKKICQQTITQKRGKSESKNIGSS